MCILYVRSVCLTSDGDVFRFVDMVCSGEGFKLKLSGCTREESGAGVGLST